MLATWCNFCLAVMACQPRRVWRWSIPTHHYIKSTSPDEHRAVGGHYITSDDITKLNLSHCEMFEVVYNCKEEAIRAMCSLNYLHLHIDAAISTSTWSTTNYTRTNINSRNQTRRHIRNGRKGTQRRHQG